MSDRFHRFTINERRDKRNRAGASWLSRGRVEAQLDFAATVSYPDAAAPAAGVQHGTHRQSTTAVITSPVAIAGDNLNSCGPRDCAGPVTPQTLAEPAAPIEQPPDLSAWRNAGSTPAALNNLTEVLFDPGASTKPTEGGAVHGAEKRGWTRGVNGSTPSSTFPVPVLAGSVADAEHRQSEARESTQPNREAGSLDLAAGNSDLPTPQCSSGTTQSEPSLTRAAKVMESAGHAMTNAAPDGSECEKEGVAPAAWTASGIRPYQVEWIDKVMGSLIEHDRVLGVAATGAGKTVMAGEICRRSIDYGPILFIADAKELVWQAADKLGKWSGRIASVEMAESHGEPGDMLVVATTQSIARRLEKWPRDYFKLIIVDEAHRNTLGEMAMAVLNHFNEAQVIGITATPFRSDKKQLGSYYQHIAAEVGLVELIKQGFLSRITIKSVPCNVDLRGVRTIAGDFREDDLANALKPHLMQCAKIMKEHATGRRSVVFLPDIATSQEFTKCCQSIGLRAVHVDGKDRSELDSFRRGEADIISNCALLTTGWDEPSVSCVVPLRATKSLVLYSQMIGRGTRIHPGKTDLLVLDPLFLSDNMSLIKPARLVARTQEEADEISEVLAGGGQMDLLEAEEEAEGIHRNKLAEKLREQAKRKTRCVDAVTFALAIGDDALSDYEPVSGWEQQEPSEKQLAALEKAGFDCQQITSKGHASRLLDTIYTRRSMGLATPKQVKHLVRFGHKNPQMATFEEASAFLDKMFSRGKVTKAAPITVPVVKAEDNIPF